MNDKKGGGKRPHNTNEGNTYSGGRSRQGGSQQRGSQQREGGYQQREDGYQQREGGYQKREGGYQQRDNQKHEGGYQQREGGGYQKREGGYQQREGGYQKREGGYQQREGGYQKREGGYQQREGGYQKRSGQKREGGYQQREGGYQQRESGYQQREGGYQKRQDSNQQMPPQPPTGIQPEAEQALPYFLMGRNAVREALKSGRSIDRILVTPEQDGSLREILALARDRGIVVRDTAKAKLDELCMPFGHNGRPGNHQGILAMVPEVEYCAIEDILQLAKDRGEQPFILLLDEINDPHNLGSMLRSACCAGVHGVVIPKRRAASVTAAVARASAGAVEYVKIAKVVNLTAAIQQLKSEGVWIAGGDMEGAPMAEVNLSGPLAFVIGNESEGLSRLVKQNCDHLVRIPICGPIDSLNASVAAAVLLFEKVRQDVIK